jgi:hypothetical protein
MPIVPANERLYSELVDRRSTKATRRLPQGRYSRRPERCTEPQRQGLSTVS